MCDLSDSGLLLGLFAQILAYVQKPYFTSPEMAEDEAQAISRRMAELRHDLTTDVRQVSREARVMTDWTFYVGRFPWAMFGLAALSGYMLIPKKQVVISPNQDALAELVRKKYLRLDVDHKREKPGLLSTLLTLVASGAAKASTAYMGERLRAVAAQKADQHSRFEASPASVH